MGILVIIIVVCIAVKLGQITKVSEKALKKSVVVIDPGHGGIDPGKVSVDETLEKDINLKIALKLRDILKKDGISVYMTREDDAGLYEESDSNKKIADMKRRMQIVSEKKADMLVSIHQNSYSSAGVKGAQVFYYSKSEPGKSLAEIIQNSIKENTEQKSSRAAKANDNYYILLHSECPAVIVECGFLSNYEEAMLLNDEKYQGKMAKAIADGIKTFLISTS